MNAIIVGDQTSYGFTPDTLQVDQVYKNSKMVVDKDVPGELLWHLE